ncbi:MAG TPA: ketoacyl-ACP synthase III [candidate division WOR-3 bacterium]|uniref:Beta-ketoacyl-[acyl-carrier-protein] synthase III n=1 Tax=candidate division WOR-3 bacterium TaxID=2052148 RepID=A0A7C1BAE0_UNCW3|nr:MAG: 3-oxoacyl-ACP synthase [Candidatus Hydrothermae bacterium]HDM90391.1 ketoacyl-ACP synthase III [candidate division WOR-3 bacterium]
MGVRIIGIGHYVPDRVVTNHDLEKIMDTSDEWIVTRTGIRERRYASPDQANSDLSYEAARVALSRAGVQPQDLDIIIVATVTPDMSFPSTACLVQAKLGIRERPCFDMEAACPGFLYGLELMRGLLSLGDTYRTGLLIGTEVLTRILDPLDRNTAVLFGDGSGAAVLVKDDSEFGIISTYLGGDGELGNLLYLPAGGSRMPTSEETVRNRQHYIKMKGREVFRHAVQWMQQSAFIVLEKAGMKPEDITWLVPHQANIRIIDSTRERLGLPPEKVYVNIDKYGNTSAASIPIALSEMHEKGLLKKGDIVLLVSFGAGFTWGAVLMRWG